MKIRITGIILIFLISAVLVSAQINTNATYTNPSSCGPSGAIHISGVTSGHTYLVAYNLNSVSVSSFLITASNDTLKIAGLFSGTYNNIVVTDQTNNPSTSTSISGSYTLADGCIAKQSTIFLATAYENFTGIQDDDPANFSQVYARLNVPINKVFGIPSSNKSWKRIIFLRNGFFQLTYGNTNDFKMYAFDTLKNKYVNSLDLLAHSYLNANASLNIFTIIVPDHNNPTGGDLFHIYFDGMLSGLFTHVTDTFSKSSSATDKTITVQSLMPGFNLKAKFNPSGFQRFGVEIGSKILWIFPSSSTVNPRLNPQNSNAEDIYNPQNSTKSFIRSGIPSYINFDAIISYNTAKNPLESSSNIFMHYSRTSNLAKVFGKNFPDNYFQFQIGYTLDVTKLFAPKP